MTDEDYFKYKETLAPEGERRLFALMDSADTLAEELGTAEIANETLKKDREELETLKEVFSDIVADYKAAMSGESLPETWESDILAAESLLKLPPRL